MRSVARVIAAGGAMSTLAGCALLAGYDFGKYGEEGAGGGASSATSGTGGSPSASSGHATSTSTGTGGSTDTCTDGGAAFGAPMPLLGTALGPIAITGDLLNVYWTADGAIPGPKSGGVYRSDKTGNTGVVLAPQQTSPRAIQVDDTDVYWVGHQQATTSEIWQVDKTSNGTATAAAIWSVAPGIVNDIFVHGKVVYFTYDLMGVYQIDLGSKNYQPVLKNAAGTTPKALTGDAGNLYYVEEPVPLVGKATSIMAFNRTTNVSTTLATLEDGVQGIAVDETHVYWSTPAGVRQVPRGGGAVLPLFSFTGPCAGLAVGGGYVYCTAAVMKNLFAFKLGPPNMGSTTSVFAMGNLGGATAACEGVYYIDGMTITKLVR